LKIWRDIPAKAGSLQVYLDNSYVPEIPAIGVERQTWEAFINIPSSEVAGTKTIFPAPAVFTLLLGNIFLTTAKRSTLRKRNTIIYN
jgi:hypothetical protein